MGVLYRTLYLPVAVRIGPSRQARDDTDCEGRYKVRYKNTHMIIMLSLMYMYCDRYWQP